jgi:hypothetical protein
MALLFVLLCQYAEARQRYLPENQREQLQHLTRSVAHRPSSDGQLEFDLLPGSAARMARRGRRDRDSALAGQRM